MQFAIGFSDVIGFRGIEFRLVSDASGRTPAACFFVDRDKIGQVQQFCKVRGGHRNWNYRKQDFPGVSLAEDGEERRVDRCLVPWVIPVSGVDQLWPICQEFARECPDAILGVVPIHPRCLDAEERRTLEKSIEVWNGAQCEGVVQLSLLVA